MRDSENLTLIDTAAPSIPPSFDTPGWEAQWDWFHYSVDSLDQEVEWDIKPEAGSDLLTDWFAYFELPGSAGINGGLPGTEWDLSGYQPDKNGAIFESVTPGDAYFLTAADADANVNEQQQDPTTDAVFSWTVHSGNDTYGDLVPEPNTAFLFSLFLSGALMVRRRRNRR